MDKQHVVIIGAGVVGSAAAIEALRGGFGVTLIDAETPGGPQSASCNASGTLSPQEVFSSALPGRILKTSEETETLSIMDSQQPSSSCQKTSACFMKRLADPFKPFLLAPSRLLPALPWLCRYLLNGRNWEKTAQTAAALYPLLKDSVELHTLLAQEANVPHLIEHHGALAVFPSRAHFSLDPQSWTIRRQLGIEWKDMEEAALRSEEPDLSPAFQFAVLTGASGSCSNPGAYTKALARHAAASGAIFRQTTATGLHIEAGAVKGVYTRSGEIPCDKVVIAAGAASRALAASLGDAVSLETERAYFLEISGVSQGPRHPMTFDGNLMSVTRTESGLRVTAERTEIDTLDAPPRWKQTECLEGFLRAIFPGLPAEIPGESIKRGMGARSMTPDGLPCLGYASASRDVICAFGHGRAGLTASAQTARIVRQLLDNGAPEADIRPYAPNRFNLF